MKSRIKKRIIIFSLFVITLLITSITHTYIEWLWAAQFELGPLVLRRLIIQIMVFTTSLVSFLDPHRLR